jgi:hypothetical protein
MLASSTKPNRAGETWMENPTKKERKKRERNKMEEFESKNLRE